jgi:hypothetical protein
MTLSYGLRLCCLLTVVTGLVYAAAQIALSCNARQIVRGLVALGSRRQERILYFIQMVPAFLAILVAGLLCLPQYVRHEPAHAAEPVGGVTLVLAAVVCCWFGSALLRGFRTTLRTLRFARICRQSGRILGHAGGAPVLALAHPVPPLGLVGFFRPFVLVSEDLLVPGGLDPGVLQVAFDHERAHARQFDNWKLLSLCFLPRIFGDPWRRTWQLAADCAADDDAACGDPARSLSLAEALVRTARLVRPARSTVICAALTSGEAGLTLRIDRLVRTRGQSRPAGNALLAGLAGLLLVVVATAAAAFPWIYSVSECLLHLGGF